VDDLVIASTSIEQIGELEGHLRKKFSTKPRGDIDYVLGLKVERIKSCRELKLSQEMYARKVLERFTMTDCQPTTCPVAPNTTLEVHKRMTIDFPYSQAVGLIMYLAMGTRLDLAYGVGLVLQFASNPADVHVKAIKRIPRYLCASFNIELTFGESHNQLLVGHADADYARFFVDKTVEFGIRSFVQEGGVRVGE
jgi:hypothetical protein